MRPRKKRVIDNLPPYVKFKPAGVQSRELEEIILLIDEYEAVRLADYEKMKHEEAALLMEISRQTFSRLIDSARKKIAKMIIEGKSLSIEGGNFQIRGNGYKNRNHGNGNGNHGKGNGRNHGNGNHGNCKK